jgi:hypothetical protein
MAYETPRILSVDGRTIKVAHLDELAGVSTSLLTAMAASGTAATVIDTAGFSDNNLCLIGELGVDGTEVKSVNGVVSAGTSMTLVALDFAHSAGTPIRKILFNQWLIYGTADTTFVTDNLVDTVDMQLDAEYTTVVNTGTEYAYYWAVAYDSLSGGAVTGGQSDYCAATGQLLNSVGGLIKSALVSTRKEKSSIITDDWFIREINDCLKYIEGKLKHWSFLQEFDYSLGASIRGSFNYTMPADIGDANTNKSILSCRVGTDTELTYLDKPEWEKELIDTALTQVTTQAVATDTTLEIDNSYDFEDAGSVDVFISGTKYTITYTGVTRSATAGVLTGIPATGDGSITVTIPVDTNVWQYETEGKPEYYAVWEGNLYIYPLPDASYDNKNVLLDYWTSRTLVDSSSDLIEPPRYDAVKHWLCWKLHGLDNASGKLDMNDGDWMMFNSILADQIKREISGQKFKWNRVVNRITL